MIKLTNVSRVYKTKSENFTALENINLSFEKTGLYVIYGNSGCGKSTLLNLIANFERPSTGSVEFSEGLISPNEIGYIIQNSFFINDFTVKENLLMLGFNKEKIDHYLEIVGISSKKYTLVKYLSGGERQRLAIVRTLLKNVKVILMDEPTGNLDDENSNIIRDLVVQISKELLFIVVTHDRELFTDKANTYIEISQGKIINTTVNKNVNNESNFDLLINKTTDNKKKAIFI